MTDAAGSEGTGGCIFCELDAPGCGDLFLIRGRLCYVILNLYPYNNGHLMVAPFRHVATLSASTPDERGELTHLKRHAE